MVSPNQAGFLVLGPKLSGRVWKWVKTQSRNTLTRTGGPLTVEGSRVCVAGCPACPELAEGLPGRREMGAAMPSRGHRGGDRLRPQESGSWGSGDGDESWRPRVPAT